MARTCTSSGRSDLRTPRLAALEALLLTRDRWHLARGHAEATQVAPRPAQGPSFAASRYGRVAVALGTRLTPLLPPSTDTTHLIVQPRLSPVPCLQNVAAGQARPRARHVGSVLIVFEKATRGALSSAMLPRRNPTSVYTRVSTLFNHELVLNQARLLCVLAPGTPTQPSLLAPPERAVRSGHSRYLTAHPKDGHFASGILCRTLARSSRVQSSLTSRGPAPKLLAGSGVDA